MECCNCCIFIVISPLELTTTIAASVLKLKGALMQPPGGVRSRHHRIICPNYDEEGSQVGGETLIRVVKHFPEEEVHFSPPGGCSMPSSVNKYFGND